MFLTMVGDIRKVWRHGEIDFIFPLFVFNLFFYQHETMEYTNVTKVTNF